LCNERLTPSFYVLGTKQAGDTVALTMILEEAVDIFTDDPTPRFLVYTTTTGDPLMLYPTVTAGPNNTLILSDAFEVLEDYVSGNVVFGLDSVT
jgi:hypothetical protein